MGAIGRGLLAGGFGTLLLNAATYLDMALTGRAASTTPVQTTRRVAGAVGLELPDDDNRLEALGALGGLATGLGIGVAVSLARSAGVRMPAPLSAVAVGGSAMAATDLPMSAMEVSDPRTWSAADWARDVVPHLAYGAGVRWAMDRYDRSASVTEPAASAASDAQRPSRWGLIVRATALGLATGSRSSLAVGGPVLAALGRRSAVAASGLVAVELVADKVPQVPSRLEPGPLMARIIGGALGAGALVRARPGSDTTSAALAGLAGAAGAWGGAVAGSAWRELAAERGWTWQAGLVEDAVALGLAVRACR